MINKCTFILFFFVSIFTFFCPFTAEAKIIVNPLNPHYMMSNGEPIIFVGGANIGVAPEYDFKSRIDSRSSEGANYGRVWTIRPWAGTSAVFPWARSGSGIANDGGIKFDLDEWDPNYWQILRDEIEYASTKNVYLQIMVFDEVGLERAPERWYQHPFNPNNNVNSLSLPGGNTDAIPEFYDLGNHKVLQYQEAYVQKLLNETCHYDNVLYEVCNETTAPWEWQRHFINFIDQRCDSLIANNPFKYQAENLEYAKLDILNVHNLSASNVNNWFVSRFGNNKILKYDEQAAGTQTDLAIRHMGWATVTGGGHINWDEAGNPDHAHLTTKMINKFFREQSVNFINMKPSNDLTDNGYALVNKGIEYLVYNPEGGSVTVNLVDMVGAAEATWYDPQTGEYSAKSLVQGGQQKKFDPPFSGDVVLYIVRTVDETPPTIISVSSGVDPTEVTVVFSEPVEELGAVNINNYIIDQGVTISEASLGPDLKTVTLATSTHSEGITYTLTVNNIKDRARTPNVVAPNTQVSYTYKLQLVISNLTVTSGENYEIVTNGLRQGALVYVDRIFTVSDLPISLEGATYIKTSNNDKGSTGESLISFNVNQGVTIYVAHDNRISRKPTWLEAFSETGKDVVTTDTTLSIYKKEFLAETITLGGNEGSESSSMYCVIIATRGMGSPPDTSAPTAPQLLRIIDKNSL